MGENKSKTIYWVIFSIIVLIILGLFVYYFWLRDRNVSTPTPTISPTATPSETPNKYEGWQVYSNPEYYYSILYPKNAEIDSKITGCLTVNTEFGHVIIRGKNYEEICGRTGVGADYTEVSETITIEGKDYTASGFKSNDLNPYDEFYGVVLDDGSVIEYGIDSFDKEGASIEAYEKAMDEVRTIVESYTSS